MGLLSSWVTAGTQDGQVIKPSRKKVAQEHRWGQGSTYGVRCLEAGLVLVQALLPLRPGSLVSQAGASTPEQELNASPGGGGLCQEEMNR